MNTHTSQLRRQRQDLDEPGPCTAAHLPTVGQLTTTAGRLGYRLREEQFVTLQESLSQAEPAIARIRSERVPESDMDPLAGEVAVGRRHAAPQRTAEVTRLHTQEARGDQDAVSAVSHALELLRAADAKFNCTISFREADSLRAAAESVERHQTGRARALEGIPFAVKDVIDVQGSATTGGSQSRLAAPPAQRSATVVARLQAAGAIPISKDSTTEFACGGPHSPIGGFCRNPWDAGRWAGGSSSGTAVAVATGAVPFGIGTDVGGSIRLPAAWCGVTGLKPTAGRVSRAGVIPMSWTAEVVGPIARDARTITRVLSIISGADDQDPKTGPHSSFSAQPHDPTSIRVAVPEDAFFTECDSEILNGLNRMVNTLGDLGVRRTGASIPSAHLAHDIAYQVVFAEAAAVHRSLTEDWTKYDPVTVSRIARGIATPASDYIRALQFRKQLQSELHAVFRSADLILIPTVPATAPTLPSMELSVNGVRHPAFSIQARFTMICNFTGFPALTVPTGTSPDGCPTAAMLIAPPYREDVALSIAELFQDYTNHHTHEPAWR